MLTTFLNDKLSKFKHFSPVRVFIELTFKLKVNDQSYLWVVYANQGSIVQGGDAKFQT